MEKIKNEFSVPDGSSVELSTSDIVRSTGMNYGAFCSCVLVLLRLNSGFGHALLKLVDLLTLLENALNVAKLSSQGFMEVM